MLVRYPTHVIGRTAPDPHGDDAQGRFNIAASGKSCSWRGIQRWWPSSRGQAAQSSVADDGGGLNAIRGWRRLAWQ